MTNTESKKRSIDSEWFKQVLRWQKTSIRSLGKEHGGTPWNERTIRRALQDNSMSPGLLDAIAKKINVYPDYLAGKYSWTFQLPIMREDGVRDYWISHFMQPTSYPYMFAKQKKLGTHQYLLNTLLIHGISEDSFRNLDASNQHDLKISLDYSTTDLLRRWFPNAKPANQIDYQLAIEWQTEADVMEALLDYLIERGLVTEIK